MLLISSMTGYHLSAFLCSTQQATPGDNSEDTASAETQLVPDMGTLRKPGLRDPVTLRCL